MEALLTVRQAADVLGVHPQTAYRLVWAGELARVDIGTGKRPRFRITRKSVERFIDSRQRGRAA